MNCEQLNEQLADYLGGELDAAARAEVERHLSACTACAAEADSLGRALAALRAMPDAQPGERTADAAVRSGARAVRGAAMLRYAAAILIAFTLGYIARDRSPGHPAESDGPAVVRQAGGPAVASTTWQQRAAEAYAQQSNRSGLARSLVALSRVGK